MAAGYSSTPLLKKLGIKQGMKVLLIAQPEDYFRLLLKDLSSQFCKKNEMPDFIHLFVKTNKDFESQCKRYNER